MTSVDVAVVGRGLIGSAAARYLAERGLRTALIGPDEPEDRLRSAGPFSSHGDQGRITRLAGRTQIWSELAARSIRSYRDIEERSGERFYTSAGLVVAVPDLEAWVDHGLITGSNIRKVEHEWLRQATGIAVPDSSPLAYEGPPAGHINPRRLVAAQTRLTEIAEGTVIRDAVSSIESNAGGYRLSGSWGSLEASRILLATGAFGRHLVERELKVERRPRTVVLAETALDKPLPCLIASSLIDDRLAGVYWVPPVPYPDGRSYLKIGGSLLASPLIDAEAELVDWFHGDGDATEIDALEVTLRGLLPDAKFVSFTSQPCVITGTVSEYPYIGWVDEKVAVAVGGNGSAAKSSDELGRLAASLFDDDGWTDKIDQAVFQPVFTEDAGIEDAGVEDAGTEDVVVD